MNKHYLVLFLGIIIHWGFAQQWVDSIDAARRAYHKKNYADAERIYKSQYEKAKSKGGIDEELAQTKYRQRDYKGAIHFYQKKLKSVKNKTEKARIKHNLGNSYFEKGDYAKAIKAYKEALRLNPSNDKTCPDRINQGCEIWSVVGVYLFNNGSVCIVADSTAVIIDFYGDRVYRSLK